MRASLPADREITLEWKWISKALIISGLERTLSWLWVRKRTGQLDVVVVGKALAAALVAVGLAPWVAAVAKLLGLPVLPMIDQPKLVVG